MVTPPLSNLKPVYLIHGPEEYRLSQAVGRLIDRLAAVADLDYNLTILDGDRVDGDTIVNAANTLPFMSERRIVVVRGADTLSAGAIAAVAAYAADPNPAAVLVLVATKVARGSSLYKAIDVLGGIAEYKAPKKQDYPHVVASLFKERGVKAAPEAAEALVRVAGHDLRRIAIEVDKVVAFVGDAKNVTREDIERVVAPSAPPSVFEFTDALADRKTARALLALRRLLDAGESVYGIHAMSVRRVRQLLSVRAICARTSGGAVSEVSRELGLRDWQSKRLVTQSREFTTRELVDALKSAAEIECVMKTTSHAELAFERWVVEVCAGRRADVS